MRTEPIRAAVISDTHGVLRPEVEKVIQNCDVVIHAGDFDNQMVYHKLKIKQPLYAVRGNNDGNWAEQLPKIKRFQLGGVNFVMAHERSDIPIDLEKAQVVIFGHSHRYYQRMEAGRLWLNPGSCGYRRFTLPLSMATITIQDGNWEVGTVWLEEGSGRQKEESGQEVKKPERMQMDRGLSKPLREENKEKDQLFMLAKIMRFMKRGETVSWVAENLRLEPLFVERVYRLCVTHPGAGAHQILDKLEVNRLFVKD